MDGLLVQLSSPPLFSSSIFLHLDPGFRWKPMNPGGRKKHKRMTHARELKLLAEIKGAEVHKDDWGEPKQYCSFSSVQSRPTL